MEACFTSDLATYIRAGYPILYVVTSEEDRAIDLIDETLRLPDTWKQPRQLCLWSISRGVVDADGRTVGNGNTNEPGSALHLIATHKEPAVFVLKDFHPWLKDNAKDAALVVRMLRDLAPALRGSGKTIVWLSAVQEIPAELEKDVTLVDLPLPTEPEYRGILDTMIEQVKGNPRVTVDLDDDARDEIVKACQGLTRAEAENALAKAIVSQQGLARRDVQAILSEKEQIIRKSGILEYTASVESFGQVGGLGNLKRWLKQRNEGFTQRARDFGLPHPRGVMLVGVPGCGKSLCAKAVASEWNKPLLRFDLGRVFAGLVGESEERMRRALATAEGVAPAILWIDEVEKGLAGTSGGGDGGVAARVFGNLLTWMEEKTKPVFVVMTANDISKLPPELLRKGRVDEIFFVDLPTPQERAEILGIHLARRGQAPTEFDFRRLAEATEGFSGAELAEVVNSALYEAFVSPEKRLTTDLLVKAAKETVPLSRSRANEIASLRQWAAANSRMAAIPLEDATEDTAEEPGGRFRWMDV